MTQLTTTKRICDHLEKYVFDNVWNEPYNQSRTYIVPELISPVERWEETKSDDTKVQRVRYTPATGFLRGRYNMILLPPYETNEVLQTWLANSNNRYYVYNVPRAFFGTTTLDITNWTLFSRFCTGRCEDITVMTRTGVVLNRGYIYIRQDDQNANMLVAVDAAMWEKCVGSTVTPEDVIFRFYLDSDRVADDVIGATRFNYGDVSGIVSEDALDRITVKPYGLDAIPLNKANYVVYNGRLAYGEYASRLQTYGYVEAVVDKDILGKFEVDPFDTNLHYTVEGSEDHRVIIHIPKSLNPNFFLITPNTCDIWMVPTQLKTIDQTLIPIKGVKVYPAGRADYFHQLTHNDFSINSSLLASIAEQEGFTDYKLVVYVRTHGKEDVFIRDANYIDFLYNLTDDEILTFLRGDHEQQAEDKLLFWKAELLEGSKYADAMLRKRCTIVNYHENGDTILKVDTESETPTPVPQCSMCGIRSACPLAKAGENITSYVCPHFTTRSIQDYIDILGYFHVLSLIGKRVHHFKVVVPGTNEIVVSVPLALAEPELDAEDWYPVVYHNGLRVPQSKISFHKTTSTNVGIKPVNHNDTSEVSTAEVIESNYATRLRIKIEPTYVPAKGDLISQKYIYYCQDPDGSFRKAVLVSQEAYDADYQEGDVVAPVEKNHMSSGVLDLDIPLDETRQFDVLAPEEKDVVDGIYGHLLSEYPSKFFMREDEFYLNDTLSVELFDNRTDGETKIIQMPNDSTVEVKITTKTEDQWEIYRIDQNELYADNTRGYKYVLIPKDDLGYFSPTTKTLTFSNTWTGTNNKLLFIEGPKTTATDMDFEIQRGSVTVASDDSRTHDVGTVGYIGKGLFPRKDISAFPGDMELIFLNNKRLVPNLDYTIDGTRRTADSAKVQNSDLFVQNLSYLNKGENALSAIRTQTTVLGEQQRGYIIGKYVSWEGQSTLWFDELSTLVIDGYLCPMYTQFMGKITIPPTRYRNGAPYEVKTAVSSLIKDIMDYDEAMNDDLEKIRQLKEFFSQATVVPQMNTIIPHSHRVYSVYLEEIVAKYLTDESFDFAMLSDKTAFEAQFSSFSWLKQKDVIFRSSGQLSTYDLGFTDLYAIYHPLLAKYREDYAKLSYLADMLLPQDNIKHKDVKK